MKAEENEKRKGTFFGFQQSNYLHWDAPAELAAAPSAAEAAKLPMTST